MSLPAFVINLDRAPERLEHFRAEAHAAGLGFERLQAVDASLMTPAQCMAWVDKSAIYALSPSEIGCILSHRLAWEKIAASGAAWGAVFEDDACLSKDLGMILAQAAAAPEDIDIIKLEATGGEKILLDPNRLPFAGRHMQKLRGLSVGSAGYLISSRACRRLIEAPRHYAVPLDVYLFSTRRGAFRNLSVAIVAPAPVVQSCKRMNGSDQPVLASQITDRRQRILPRLSPAQLVKREIHRVADRMSSKFRARGAQEIEVDWG